ncbi:Asp-tRNA(Asn)/Glu-tRNA(Gln) amidotransferase subunit GatC [bacterium]|nr:Asp-tRNA(Asn)/Glu-tRNA(Gln) amidotransferase subunit GatC [bacterium]
MDQKTVLHIARLARLGLTAEELQRFGGQLTEILEYVEALQGVDIEGAPPFSDIWPPRVPWREDEVTNPPSETGELPQAPRVKYKQIEAPSPLGDDR